MAKSVRKKHFCKLSLKDVNGDMDTFIGLVSTPSYICDKCCRVSSSKQNLCHPKKLKRNSD